LAIVYPDFTVFGNQLLPYPCPTTCCDQNYAFLGLILGNVLLRCRSYMVVFILCLRPFYFGFSCRYIL